MSNVTLSLESHKQLFAERIVPVVEKHARIVFRFLRRKSDEYADAIADCIAHAWEGYVSALRAGKEPWLFPSMLATFAACKTKMGRKVGKRIRAKDVFNAARSGRTQLSYLADDPAWYEVLVDDSITPVLEQVAFRIDFPAWLATLTARNRMIAESLAGGTTTKDVANRFQLTRGRVSQLRQEFWNKWEAFTA